MEIVERHCTGCDKTKPIEDFVKDKYDKSGYTYRCKKCRGEKQKEWVLKNPEKVKAINDANQAKRKEFYSSPKGIESSRRAHLKRCYGITLEQYNEMLNIQGGKCGLCLGNETHDKYGVLAVDHCHDSGKVRALLCFKCNAGLGFFNDNKDLLTKAIQYLHIHQNT